MSTRTPRIQVTLGEDAYGVVTRLAALQKRPRSTIVSEVINDLAPVLAQLIDTMEAAARVREENIRGVRDASMEALDRMQSVVDDANDQFSLLDELVRRAGDKPPCSNTGATDAPNPLKTNKRGSAKKGVGK